MTIPLQPFEREALYALFLAQCEELHQARQCPGDPQRIQRLQESVDRLCVRLKGDGSPEGTPRPG